MSLSTFHHTHTHTTLPPHQVFDILEAQTVSDVVALPPRSTMTRARAIQLIQIHERARQGRLRAKFMQGIRDQERRDRRRLELQEVVEAPNPEEAAVEIQRHVRGMLARKRVALMRLEEMRLIGMVPPEAELASSRAGTSVAAAAINRKPRKNDAVVRAAKIAEARYQTQAQYETQYQASLLATKRKILTVEGPDIKENMSDRIREWFLAAREQTGKFPDFPDEAAGGSNAIFNPPPPPADGEEADGDAKGKKKGKKGGKKSAAGSAKKKDAKKGGAKKGKGGDDEEEEESGPAPSAFRGMLQQANQELDATWAANAVDRRNVFQKHDLNMVQRLKRAEAEEELRKQVDELMRQELKNLKAAVDAEKKGKKGGKKGKGKKGGKKKGKKGKGKKGKGKKGKVRLGVGGWRWGAARGCTTLSTGDC